MNIVVFTRSNSFDNNPAVEISFNTSQELEKILSEHDDGKFSNAIIYSILNDPLKLQAIVRFYFSNSGVWTVDY